MICATVRRLTVCVNEPAPQEELRYLHRFRRSSGGTLAQNEATTAPAAFVVYLWLSSAVVNGGGFSGTVSGGNLP